jgi:hypothetical protein
VATDPLPTARRAFLVEHYGIGESEASAAVLADSLARAARGRRDDVHLIGSACVPSDESFLSLFGAPTLDIVADAVARAGVEPDRIVPVLWLGCSCGAEVTWTNSRDSA